MIRLALYITLAIFVGLGAALLANHQGTIMLNWQGWEIRLSAAIFCLLIFLYTLFCWYLFKLYRWFRTDNPLRSPKRLESRREKGRRELDLGWSALAVEDKATALKHGQKARSLLPGDNDPIRLLLRAGGENPKEDYLGLLHNNPASQLIALKARLEQASAAQNIQESLNILQEMRQLRPGNPWIAGKIFDMLTRAGKWAEATEALNQLVKSKKRDGEKHLRAVLQYQQALEADLSGQKTSARNFAEAALKNDPKFIPAAVLLARQHLAQGDTSKARKVTEATWKHCPHPDLGQFFLELEAMESPSEKFRRIQKFSGINEADRHSLHLRAKTALDTAHWAEAKQALSRLVDEERATQVTYHLLARLEREQKNDAEAAEAYMARAAKAQPDPTWQCAICETKLENYVALCPNCQNFGQIHWQGGA